MSLCNDITTYCKKKKTKIKKQKPNTRMPKASVWTHKEDSSDSSFIMLLVSCLLRVYHSTTGEFVRCWWFQSVLSNQRPVHFPGPPLRGYHWFLWLRSGVVGGVWHDAEVLSSGYTTPSTWAKREVETSWLPPSLSDGPVIHGWVSYGGSASSTGLLSGIKCVWH